jgi:hypothetical protein
LNQKLKEKITESLSSVLPVTCIVLILGITIAPIPLDPLMLFLAGAAFLIIGMGFFTLGVDMAMMPIGEKVGAQLAQAKRLPVIIVACIIIGAVVTVAEPDLQVLAGQTPAGHGAHPGSSCRSRFLPGTCISSLPLRLEPFPYSYGLLYHPVYHGFLHSR